MAVVGPRGLAPRAGARGDGPRDEAVLLKVLLPYSRCRCSRCALREEMQARDCIRRWPAERKASLPESRVEQAGRKQAGNRLVPVLETRRGELQLPRAAGRGNSLRPDDADGPDSAAAQGGCLHGGAPRARRRQGHGIIRVVQLRSQGPLCLSPSVRNQRDRGLDHLDLERGTAPLFRPGRADVLAQVREWLTGRAPSSGCTAVAK